MIGVDWFLLTVPALPLLLAVPALRRRMPWPEMVALLPAIGLVVAPSQLTLTIPGALFGDAGLAIDTTARWWLAMSLVPWIAVAYYSRLPESRPFDDSRRRTWLLLCMAGQTGAVLSNDTATFFAFSSLMGYAFYGLLVSGNGGTARRAARIYLVLVVIADILLFEALLTGAWVTQDHSFAGIAGMTSSPLVGLYLYMVIIGFALKAGFWPIHAWLPLACGAERPAVRLLIWTIPVATALLGMVRWLPLGQIAEPVAGMLLQAAGSGAVLLAALFGLRKSNSGQRVAYVIIVVTGVVAALLGTGLAEPVLWDRYGRLLPILVLTAGWGLTAMIVAVRMSAHGRAVPSGIGSQQDTRTVWIEVVFQSAGRWGNRIGYETLPGLCAWWLAGWRSLQATVELQMPLDAIEQSLRRWSVAIVLYVLVVMLVTLASYLPAS